MGHGAPKKIDSIPIQTVVNIYAWEGMLHSEMGTMAALLKLIFAGSEDKWNELDECRKKVVFYNQQYTKAILSLQISQNKG